MAHVGVSWGSGTKYTYTIYYTITRAGVPLFFMTTGYLLLSQQENVAVFAKKHFLPVLFSFFFWSTAYALIGSDALDKGITSQSIWKLFLHILRSATVGYFWFFYSLIGLYLFVPILRLIIAKNHITAINYYIILWFLSFAIAPMIRTFVDMDYGLEAPLVQRYLGYFLLGYCLGQAQDGERGLLYVLAIFLASILFTFAVFYFDLPPTDNEDFFRSYMSFNIIGMASSFFLILKWFGKSIGPRLSRVLEIIDQTTFGIYLTHLIILNWMINNAELFGLSPPYQTALFVPVVTLGAFLTSSIITGLLRKIPIIKYTVPQLGK